jgi:hypothetical protein
MKSYIWFQKVRTQMIPHFNGLSSCSSAAGLQVLEYRFTAAFVMVMIINII